MECGLYKQVVFRGGLTVQCYGHWTLYIHVYIAEAGLKPIVCPKVVLIRSDLSSNNTVSL